MLPKKFFATKEELEECYSSYGSMLKVAKHYGVSKKLVLNYMNKYRIMRNKIDPAISIGKVTELSKMGLSGAEIARRTGLTSARVYQIAKKQNLALHDDFHKGFRITDGGYKLIMMKGHHEADAVGYVREHRLVAEQMIGRPIGPDEIVHHINGDKLDNSQSNLQVMTKSEHNKLHHTGKKGRDKDIGKRKRRSEEIVCSYMKV